MGTISLVESFTDIRNVGTLLTYCLLARLIWIGFVTENRQQSAVVIMVSENIW